jgi:hypothetical protein
MGRTVSDVSDLHLQQITTHTMAPTAVSKLKTKKRLPNKGNNKRTLVNNLLCISYIGGREEEEGGVG